MSFSENLQTLRKSKNISQEQLAERLDVSRQAVSKWETDGGYPEMDKIVALCGIFGCTMDELVTGKVSVNKPADRKIYDDHFNRFSKGIAIGVMLLIFAPAMVVLFSVWGERLNSAFVTEGIVPSAFMMFVAVAVAMLIILGVEHANFRKTHHSVPEIYTPEEVERFNTGFFPRAIATGVAMIIVAMVPIIVLEAIDSDSLWAELAPAFFLTVVACGVGLLIHAGIQHLKYNTKEYNSRNIKEYGIQDGDNPALLGDSAYVKVKKKGLSDKICSIIMLTATGVFLTIGFLTNEWHPTWAVFPLGGILCAIVSVALER